MRSLPALKRRLEGLLALFMWSPIEAGWRKDFSGFITSGTREFGVCRCESALFLRAGVDRLSLYAIHPVFWMLDPVPWNGWYSPKAESQTRNTNF